MSLLHCFRFGERAPRVRAEEQAMWCPKVKSTDEDDAPGYRLPQSYKPQRSLFPIRREIACAKGKDQGCCSQIRSNLSNFPLETFERNALRRTCFGKGSSYRRDRDGAVVNRVLVGTLLLQSPDPTESSLVAAGK